jgi:hypothetical protein
VEGKGVSSVRNQALLAIMLAFGCDSYTGLESNPVTLTLTAPADVTGTWSVIDTSHVLSCEYNLTANAIGGAGDEAVSWGDATITLLAPPALPAMQPHPAARVAQWFGGPIIRSGSARIASISIGRERPFIAEHQMKYRNSRGVSSVATVTVHCHAPSH